MQSSRKETKSTVIRRTAILNHLDTRGQVDVKELSKTLGVSSVTIRNDLQQLEKKNLLLRARGGAMRLSQSHLVLGPPLSDKQKQNLIQKKEIGREAAALVEEGNTIILDSGTTTFELAKNLDKFENLTVITNAINIANYLSMHKNISVIVPGGILRPNSLSLVGMLAEKGVQNYFCDKLFLGVDGFDIDHGISTHNSEEAHMNRAMIEVSRKVIVVADSSKFQTRAFGYIAEINKIHLVITDKAISPEQKSNLERMGIEVRIAST